MVLETIFESRMPLGVRQLIRREPAYSDVKITSLQLYQKMVGANRTAAVRNPIDMEIPIDPKGEYYQCVCLTLFHFNLKQISNGVVDFIKDCVIFSSQVMEKYNTKIQKEQDKGYPRRPILIQITGKIYLILNTNQWILCENWLIGIINYCYVLKTQFDWWLIQDSIQLKDEWDARLNLAS